MVAMVSTASVVIIRGRWRSWTKARVSTRSPERTAAVAPQRALAVGRPRRVSAPSTTSSWSRLPAWISSPATATSTSPSDRRADGAAEEEGQPRPGALGGAGQDQVARRLHEDLGALRTGVGAGVQGLGQGHLDVGDEGFEVDGGLQQLFGRLAQHVREYSRCKGRLACRS